MNTTARRVLAALKRKIGPLPAWAWLAGLATVMLYLRSRGGSGAAADNSQPVADSGGLAPLAPFAGAGALPSLPSDNLGDLSGLQPPFNDTGSGSPPIVYDPGSDSYSQLPAAQTTENAPVAAAAPAAAPAPPELREITSAPTISQLRPRTRQLAVEGGLTGRVLTFGQQIIGGGLPHVFTVPARPARTRGQTPPRRAPVVQGEPKNEQPFTTPVKPRTSSSSSSSSRSTQSARSSSSSSHASSPPPAVRETTTAPTISQLRPRTQQQAVAAAGTNRVATHGQVLQ